MSFYRSAFGPPSAVLCLWMAVAAVGRAEVALMRQEIVNLSSTRWNIDFRPEGSRVISYSVSSGSPGATPRVETCHGVVALPPGSRMHFEVHRMEPEVPDTSEMRFSLGDDRGEGAGSLQVSLMTGPLGSPMGFRRGVRAFGREQRELVTMSDRVICISDYRPQDRMPPEDKAEAGLEGKAERGPGAGAGAGAAGAGAPEAKSKEPGPSKGSLPPISESDQLAGVDKADIYNSMDKIRAVPAINLRDPKTDWSSVLHDHGHLIPAEVLADLFFNTVFQYNTSIYMGYKPGINYDDYMLIKGPRRKPAYIQQIYPFYVAGGPAIRNSITPSGDLAAYIAFKTAFEQFLDSFMKNPNFVLLGTGYMRQKVVVEKISHAMNRFSGEKAEQLSRLLYVHDRLDTDLQTMALNWMTEAFKAFRKQFEDASPERRMDAGGGFDTYQPAFLLEPYYAEIMKKIVECGMPVPKVGDLPLP